ncbi:MAG: purine-nucleoside phosphorylase [Bacilli bacterium]|nr:purine-nucleoside phosphorylase [Bacilli bacterium]
MATVHNEAHVGEISKLVVMAGDPLRVKMIASKYLENPKLVNDVRGMYAYTGTYKNVLITIMAHGMGMPSAGIYVYELFKYYNVEKIIRIGTCGAYSEDLNLLDVILVDKSYTESNYAFTLNNEHVNLASSSFKLNSQIEDTVKELNLNVTKGNVVTSDCFDWYMTDLKSFLNRIPNDLNIIAAEMESFAIFYIASMFKKEASCLLTVVDSHYKNAEISSEEREKSLDNMTLIALNSIIK